MVRYGVNLQFSQNTLTAFAVIRYTDKFNAQSVNVFGFLLMRLLTPWPYYARVTSGANKDATVTGFICLECCGNKKILVEIK